LIFPKSHEFAELLLALTHHVLVNLLLSFMFVTFNVLLFHHQAVGAELICPEEVAISLESIISIGHFHFPFAVGER